MGRSYTELVTRRLKREKWLQKGNVPQGHSRLWGVTFSYDLEQKEKEVDMVRSWYYRDTHVGRLSANVAACKTYQ